MKVKAKAKGDITKVKMMFKNPMAGPEEAKKKKIKSEFITQITAVYNGAVVYEVTTSGFVSKNPLFKFEFKGGKKGDKLEITTVDNNGKKESKKAKIK